MKTNFSLICWWVFFCKVLFFDTRITSVIHTTIECDKHSKPMKGEARTSTTLVIWAIFNELDLFIYSSSQLFVLSSNPPHTRVLDKPKRCPSLFGSLSVAYSNVYSLPTIFALIRCPYPKHTCCPWLLPPPAGTAATSNCREENRALSTCSMHEQQEIHEAGEVPSLLSSIYITFPLLFLFPSRGYCATTTVGLGC